MGSCHFNLQMYSWAKPFGTPHIEEIRCILRCFRLLLPVIWRQGPAYFGIRGCDLSLLTSPFRKNKFALAIHYIQFKGNYNSNFGIGIEWPMKEADKYENNCQTYVTRDRCRPATTSCSDLNKRSCNCCLSSSTGLWPELAKEAGTNISEAEHHNINTIKEIELWTIYKRPADKIQ